MSVTRKDIEQLKRDLECLQKEYEDRHAAKTFMIGAIFDSSPEYVVRLQGYISQCLGALREEKFDDASKEIHQIFENLDQQFTQRATKTKKSDVPTFITEKLNKELEDHIFFRGIGTILGKLPQRLQTAHAENFKTLIMWPLNEIMAHRTALNEKQKKDKVPDPVTQGKLDVLEQAQLYFEAGEKLRNQKIPPEQFFLAKNNLEVCMRKNLIYYTASIKMMSETEKLVTQVLEVNAGLCPVLPTPPSLSQEIKSSDEQVYPFKTPKDNILAVQTIRRDLRSNVTQLSNRSQYDAHDRAQAMLTNLAINILSNTKAGLSQEKLNQLKEMHRQYRDAYAVHFKIGGKEIEISRTAKCIGELIPLLTSSLAYWQGKEKEKRVPPAAIHSEAPQVSTQTTQVSSSSPQVSPSSQGKFSKSAATSAGQLTQTEAEIPAAKIHINRSPS